MRHTTFLVVLLAIAVGWAVAQPPAAAPGLADLKSKASYIIGSNIGRQLKDDGIDLDLATLMRGIQDGATGVKSPLTDEQVQQTMLQFQQQVMAEQQKKAARGKADGEAFLAKNKTVQGILTLPSGVQYKVLKAGAGATPKVNDTVTTHYRGTLIDGTVFDSSYDRGEPASFGVSQVIKGWTEVLQLMKVGDKWQVFIPSDLAYGPSGRPPKIAPDSVLVFEMELLDVKPGQ